MIAWNRYRKKVGQRGPSITGSIHVQCDHSPDDARNAKVTRQQREGYGCSTRPKRLTDEVSKNHYSTHDQS